MNLAKGRSRGGSGRTATAATIVASAAFIAVAGSAFAETAPTAARGEYSSSALSDLASSVGSSQAPATPSSSAAPAPTDTATAPQGQPLPGLSNVSKTHADGSSGGASAQAVSLPGGASSVTGMGESFTTQLSTGIVSFTVPLHLLTARGGVQPRLDLAYSSGGGFGIAGAGWNVTGSAISRQTDRGIPSYDDRADWYPGQDRFTFGGQELVPICTVSGTSCNGAITGEVMPPWASGWQYFRARVEGGFLRFFWSPDHLTWRVQSKEGANFEFGVPLDGSGYTDGLERNPVRSKEIFRWYMVRQYDAEGGVQTQSSPAPVNVIVYRYKQDGGAVYLSDVYDTSPAANPTTQDLSTFAHHASLAYEPRSDSVISYRSGWPIQNRLRLTHVDVASKPFSGSVNSPRELVRRYHLEYDATSHTSLLLGVQVEGRCSTATVEGADGLLPGTNCPRLPAVKLEYQRALGTTAPLLDASGMEFESFDSSIRQMGNSPPHSLDEANVGLVDVNSDGLPDVLATQPGIYGGKDGVFFNGAKGKNAFGTAMGMGVIPVAGVDANVLQLSSPNVSTLDLDADGIANLVHMDFTKTYAVFHPEQIQGQWWWQGVNVTTVSGQDVKIDFSRDAKNTQVMDVNGDGLVDIVYSTATEYQTFFALGRFPGGDNQFGHATMVAADQAQISNDPVRTCTPWSATGVKFSDSDVRVGDLNGDGLADIARVRSGQLLYWPGRGNGFWGTGNRDDCPGGTLGENRHVDMYDAPRFDITDPGTLLLSDVNADGLADLVEVRNDAVDIYLNEGGVGWTDRRTLTNVPIRPPATNYVRLGDIDGSGSPDIIWGEAYNYQYIDLTGGVVPYLLTKVHNGLGGTTDFSYETTAQVMRDAEAAGNAWKSRTPTNSPVLVRSTVRDHLDLVQRSPGTYVTEYSYRDPLYEGRQREFRGFRDAYVKVIGDTTGPTSTQHTAFQLGECPEGQTGAADVCSSANRWKDNWREALKGLPVLSESFDEQGVYVATEHTTYRLMQLYTGRDGRRVVLAQPHVKDGFVYDSDPATFDHVASPVSLPEVEVMLSDITAVENRAVTKRAAAGTSHSRTSTFVDGFGNMLQSVREGCIEGCPNGVDETITATSIYDRPADDASGWAFREMQSYVTGSIHTEARHQLTHTYNAQGKLVETHAVLTGTLPLDRFHQVPGTTIAPAPAEASAGVNGPADVMLAHHDYDSFGRAIFVRGPNGGCSASDSDAMYQQLPIVSHSYIGTIDPGTGCGATDLVSTATNYDRGLEAATDVLDANGQPARVEYDGFGRVVKGWGPDPSSPGSLASQPAKIITYTLPLDAATTPYSSTSVLAQDGSDVNTASYHESKTFVDGLGRTIVSLSQTDYAAGDPGDYVMSGVTVYNAKGAAIRKYLPKAGMGAIGGLPSTALSSTYTSADYDAFGRVVTSRRLDGNTVSWVRRHGLSEDVYDAADLGPRAGTQATLISDGHGRGVQRIQRLHVNGSIQEQITLNEYLPTGEIRKVTQRTAGQTDVVRWLRYDSLGRMVANVEPNTSVGFNPDPDADISTIKALRYAYNDAGDLVGTSDARGCGVNYFHDAGGRLIAEDRSPCLSTQALYTSPDLATGDGAEAFYRYDAADPDTANVIDEAGTPLSVNTNLLLGRLVSVSGLGSKEIFRYDAAGRTTGIGSRVAAPGAPSAMLANRYAPRWYIRTMDLDAAGRTKTMSTGVTVPELLGTDSQSLVAFSYAKSGRVSSIGGSYGTLFSGAAYTVDGLLDRVTLGDAAATQRAFTYDVNRRIATVNTYRAAAELWSSPPPGSSYTVPGSDTTQLELEHYEFSYDEVGNITQIRDYRSDLEWPDSAKPIKREFLYDDLYRLTQATYTRASGGPPDSWTSPYAAELSDSTRTPQPSPHVSFTNRVQQQNFKYDWLGSFQQTTDDVSGFWDRSLGDTTRGTATDHPHQILSASNRALAPGSSRKGDLSLASDASGNYTDLIVRRDGACLPSSASCWQRFKYDWNEVGELVRARRWDLAGAEQTSNSTISSDPPTRAPDVELQYHYDASGNRTLKTAVDPAGVQRHTVYIFGGLELRSTTWDDAATPPDYVLVASKVQLRVPAGIATARILYSELSLPTLTSGQQHVFLELGDQIGSSSFVIDHATGELVEAATYAAYGATESDYRPGRWGEFREPFHFSGKEEDIEVGLAYFGARYYSPYLGIWVSPDPVSIHELGSDENPYQYVHASPILHNDPDGQFAPLVIVAVIVVSAIIAGGTSVAVQASQVGWGKMDWGWHGVAGAMVTGAVSGAVSGGVGAAVGAALSASTSVAGALATSTIAGAAGAGASYVTSSALAGQGMSWSGFGQAAAVGGVGGLAGAAAGIGAGAALANASEPVRTGLSAGAGALGGVGAGLGMQAAFGQHIDGFTVALSLGAGVAGAMAGWGSGQVLSEEQPATNVRATTSASQASDDFIPMPKAAGPDPLMPEDPAELFHPKWEAEANSAPSTQSGGPSGARAPPSVRVTGHMNIGLRVPVEESWGRPETLARHFADHGADFTSESAVAYAEKASEFFARGMEQGLPTKIDANGVIRMFDPQTNTFGAFNSDGTTRTFFRPSSPTYWARQPGAEVWTP